MKKEEFNEILTGMSKKKNFVVNLCQHKQADKKMEKPYGKCDLCDQYSEDLNYHKNKIHKIPIWCSLCNYEYKENCKE
jgi:hypothetical protein